MTNAAERSLSQVWDLIIVGTGMGGATVGYALAQKKLSVLFLEKGGIVATGQNENTVNTPASRIQNGWWPQPFSQTNPEGRHKQIYAAIGCGFGGSSMHYAAALERMPATDFDALQTTHQLVPCWPIPYKDFSPYYEAAEKLYGINNADDSYHLRLSEWDQALITTMRSAGLKPEQLNIGMKYDKECTECISKICHRSCKADSHTTCLKKALLLNNCFLLDFCDVEKLEADQHEVKFIHATYQGQSIKLRGKVVVLSAGALHSPQLLLKSANANWPNGLANASNQVGRNLMFHGYEIYAIWAPKRFNKIGLQKKSISIRDFYLYAGCRLGYIQSMGLSAGPGDIASFIKNRLRYSGIHHELLLSIIAKIPSYLIARFLGEASIFAALIEDDPNPDNQIKLNVKEPNGATFSYTITDDLRERANTLYRTFIKYIGKWRVLRISPSLEFNSGHPAGTCRFGNDPATSVLDANCRSHDIHNLYVVDASFMPRSGAVNPSLTIAANALRVADKIAEDFSAALKKPAFQRASKKVII